MHLPKILFGLTIASLFCAPAALAGDDAALQTLVFGQPLGAKPGYACFVRQYDKPHLASHPKQNVTSIMLLVKGTAGDEAQTTAGVDFRFRKSGKHFQAYGSCPTVGDAATGNVLHCGIDCDGGTIVVSLKDKDTVLVKLPDGIAVSAAGAADDGPSSGRFGSDDKVFKLSRAKAATCLPLALEDSDKAALKEAR